MDDEKILSLFFERSQLAIKEVDEKYGKLLRKFSVNILNDNRDAEECVNDSYLGAWNSIPPAKPKPNKNVYIICYKEKYYAAILHDENGYHGFND